MIPKQIFSTWISDKQLPEKYNKYIESWQRIMPDYSIKILSLDNVKLSPFVVQCITQKKFALAGHYARVEELYTNGGVYLDIDVEAVKPLDEFLNEKIVLGIEDEYSVNNAVILSEKGHQLLKQMLDFMDGFDISHKDVELETGPRMVTKLMRDYGWKEGLYGRFKDVLITHPKIFYPYHYTEKFNPKFIKEETCLIHHWSHSWNDRVSIIIPCYNQGKYLKDAIDSALAQTYPNTEIIVVNDGSTDDTLRIANSYGNKIKVITQQNRGLSAARNTGIKASSGGWILPLDSDDKVVPTFLEKTVGKDDIVGAWLKCFGTIQDVWKPASIHPTYIDLLKANGLFSCTLFRREVFTSTGGYDEEMFTRGKQGCNGYEDWEFWIRAAKEGYSITVIPEILINYRKHDSSMYTEAVKNHRKIIQYMKTKHPITQRL